MNTHFNGNIRLMKTATSVYVTVTVLNYFREAVTQNSANPSVVLTTEGERGVYKFGSIQPKEISAFIKHRKSI